MSPGRVSTQAIYASCRYLRVTMDVGQKERRIERVQFETDRQRVVGDVTLPPEGYQSRFSDSLNRVDVTFIPLVNAEVSPLMGGDVEKRPFIVISKSHVRIAYPVDPPGPAQSEDCGSPERREASLAAAGRRRRSRGRRRRRG